MQAECSEQRLGSATVTNRGGFFWGRLAACALCLAWSGAVSGGSFAPLLVGTGGCSTTWTGSVGAVLGKDNVDGRLFIREAPPGMGAARAGIEVGDEVVAIDGKPVGKMTPAEVHDALSGKVGTKVRITLVRAGVTIERNVERGPLAGT